MTISSFVNFRRITGWDSYGQRPSVAYREHKRLAAEERQRAYDQQFEIKPAGRPRPGRKLREGQL